MGVVIVSGSAGLIGSETVKFFAAQGCDVVGIDNDLRRYFFGAEASTEPSRQGLERDVHGYVHSAVDIRDVGELRKVFSRYGRSIVLIVHTAAQPSHDWAAREPFTDFGVNALGTLNLLELAREFCTDAPFIYTSTNKVYGDRPNALPLVERATRWEPEASHPYAEHGIDESMSVDQTTHSIFGVSKLAADAMVQEYGHYFGMKTACFRGGCLTGPNHSGAQLHGFLSYLVKCAVVDAPYTVFGYKGKQVRDNIHSKDLVAAFWEFFRAPRSGGVYNIGGGKKSNCSMVEAIAMVERLTGRPMRWSYSENNRIGDHIWWISDTRRFQADYPEWKQKYSIDAIIAEIHDQAAARLYPA